MEQETKTIDQLVTEYAAEHPELFESTIFHIDSLIGEAVAEYDKLSEQIKNDIINDPNPIADPQQEMRTRMKQAQTETYDRFLEKIEAYKKTLV